MSRGVRFLAAWFVMVLLGSGTCVSVIPPGGVAWPYYIFMSLAPVGAFRYARYEGSSRVVAVYGVVAGFLLSWPPLGDGLKVSLGTIPPELVALKIALCTVLIALTCMGSFALGRRRSKPNQRAITATLSEASESTNRLS